MAKEYASRIAVEIADEAVQIHGGAGYVDNFPVKRFYRDAKITQIYEGTMEIQKNIIARKLLNTSAAHAEAVNLSVDFRSTDTGVSGATSVAFMVILTSS